MAAAKSHGRDELGCIILGRGEDDSRVLHWLTTAAGVPGFIGFAVGRTSFWDPLVNWRANKITRDAAAKEISRRYREFVEVFELRHKQYTLSRGTESRWRTLLSNLPPRS